MRRESAVIENLKKYIEDVSAEMQRVTWPKPEELRGQTILVFIVAFMLTVFIGGVDVALSAIMNTLHEILGS